jgi:hypothetical protein
MGGCLASGKNLIVFQFPERKVPGGCFDYNLLSSGEELILFVRDPQRENLFCFDDGKVNEVDMVLPRCAVRSLADGYQFFNRRPSLSDNTVVSFDTAYHTQ